MEEKSSFFSQSSKEVVDTSEIIIKPQLKSELYTLEDAIHRIDQLEDICIYVRDSKIGPNHFLALNKYFCNVSKRDFSPVAFAPTVASVPTGWGNIRDNIPQHLQWVSSTVRVADTKPIMILALSESGADRLREMHAQRRHSGWIYCMSSRAHFDPSHRFVPDIKTYILYKHADGSLALGNNRYSAETACENLEYHRYLSSGGNIVVLGTRYTRGYEYVFGRDLIGEVDDPINYFIPNSTEELMNAASALKGHIILYACKTRELAKITADLRAAGAYVIRKSTVALGEAYDGNKIEPVWN